MRSQLKSTLYFRQLNQQGRLLLANAWDIASAKIFAAAGYVALGTTSGGIAYSQGMGDAQKITPTRMFQQIAAIAQAVDIPLNADIEAGYGLATHHVFTAVQQAMASGAVGVNIEDNSHGLLATPLFPLEQQILRLKAAREAAESSQLPLWINARTDTYLLGAGQNSHECFDITVARGKAYLAAGADMVFIPGVVDLSLLQQLVVAIGGPINVMAMPGGPSAEQLFQAGASRVSLGVCPMLAVMGAIHNMAAEFIHEGVSATMNQYHYGFAEAEQLFAAKSSY